MKSKPINLPRLTDDAEYSAAFDKLTTLRLDLVEAEKKKNSILTDINSPRLERNPIQEAAQKMLNGDTTPISSDMSKKLLEGYAELCTRITVIQTAIKMQEKIVEALLSAASFKVVNKIQPIHRENVRNIIERLKELDAALTVEHDLRAHLVQSGFNMGLIRHMSINSLGLLSDQYSRSSAYVLEAFREGFISQSELPENLQKTLPPAPVAKKPVIQAIKAKFDDWTAAA
jgi:hypothetical protein